MYAIELFLWGRHFSIGWSHSLIRKKKRLYRDMFLNPVTRAPSLTQGLFCGLERVSRSDEMGVLGEAPLEKTEAGALGAQRKKESPYSENSPDLLWVHPICQHLASVT